MCSIIDIRNSNLIYKVTMSRVLKLRIDGVGHGITFSVHVWFLFGIHKSHAPHSKIHSLREICSADSFFRTHWIQRSKISINSYIILSRTAFGRSAHVWKFFWQHWSYLPQVVGVTHWLVIHRVTRLAEFSAYWTMVFFGQCFENFRNRPNIWATYFPQLYKFC
jgi:hypothetical protein